MKKLIVFGVILAGLIGLGIHTYNWANQLQMTAIAKETELSKQYLDNQNELGAYISSFYEQVSVANLKSDKMDKILLDAVKGRYDNEMSSAKVGQGQLFSAIKEAYPDLGTNMQLYDKIMDFVQKGREQYKNVQTKLLTDLQDYDQWRKSGLVQSKVLAFAGVPTDALQAHLGRQVLTGEAAIRQMYIIVLPSDAAKAYESGTLDPLKIPHN